MKKFALLVALGAVALVAPAQAAHQSRTCKVHTRDYTARGTLVSSSLTQIGRHTYNGTLVVNVTHASHKAPTGTQTYTLSNAHVRFFRHVSKTNPPAGSRVQLIGRITTTSKRCSTGFTPMITVKRVDIRRAK